LFDGSDNPKQKGQAVSSGSSTPEMSSQINSIRNQPISPPVTGPVAEKKFVASNWKAIRKNSLLGLFDLLLPSGMILTGCQLHQKNEARWVGLPATRYAKQDGTLSDYIKVVDFNGAQARARFQEFAKAAVDELIAAGGAG
jgi:hypothetical protein